MWEQWKARLMSAWVPLTVTMGLGLGSAMQLEQAEHQAAELAKAGQTQAAIEVLGDAYADARVEAKDEVRDGMHAADEQLGEAIVALDAAASRDELDVAELDRRLREATLEHAEARAAAGGQYLELYGREVEELLALLESTDDPYQRALLLARIDQVTSASYEVQAEIWDHADGERPLERALSIEPCEELRPVKYAGLVASLDSMRADSAVDDDDAQTPAPSDELPTAGVSTMPGPALGGEPWGGSAAAGPGDGAPRVLNMPLGE